MNINHSNNTITSSAGAVLTLPATTGTSEITANKDATGGYAGLTLFKLNLKNAANTFTNFFTNATTAARTWTLPDKDGTVAMTSDIPTFPMGEIEYFNITGTAITISGVSDGSTNMVKVDVATTADNDLETDNGGADNGRIRYTGTATKMFHCAITVSGTPANANDVFVFGAAKNGTVDCKALGSASGTQFSALHCMLSLATNDYVELYVGNTTAARNFTAKTLNIFMMGI